MSNPDAQGPADPAAVNTTAATVPNDGAGSTEPATQTPSGAVASPNASSTAPLPELEPDADAESDFGPPFVPKTFGGAFVWARGANFVATVLRVKEGKIVPVATQNRLDMHVMLTGGRAVLEVDDGEDVDRVELIPAAPVPIQSDCTYRLVALTEVELFTVFTMLS